MDCGRPEKDGTQHDIHGMKFFHILKPKVLQDGRTLGSYPFQHDAVLGRLEFFDDRLIIDRMDVEHREPLRQVDPHLDGSGMIRVLQFKEENLFR